MRLRRVSVVRGRCFASPLRQKTNFLHQINAICPVQSLPQKQFPSRHTQISTRNSAVSSLTRGGSRSSRTRGGMRWTRQRQAREMFAGRLFVSGHGAQDVGAEAYGKTVWFWHPWLMSSCRWRIWSNRIDQPSSRQRWRQKGIRLQGELGISRQTIAQGMPACPGCTCMLVCASHPLIAHETAGAASTRHSLLPLRRDKVHASLGRKSRREKARSCQRTLTQTNSL